MYQAYRAITEVTKPWDRASTHLVLYGRSDAHPGHALELFLASECNRHHRWCDVDVVDEPELRSGWPRHSISKSGFARRQKAALADADFVVVYGHVPSQHVEGRDLLLERTFLCKVLVNGRSEPRDVELKVTIFGRR